MFFSACAIMHVGIFSRDLIVTDFMVGLQSLIKGVVKE